MRRREIIGILLIMPLIISVVLAMYYMIEARIIFGGVIITASFVTGLILLSGEE